MSALLCALGLALYAPPAPAQVPAGGPATVAPLFANAEPLEVTFVADFTLLEGDRGDERPERPARLRWRTPDGEIVDVRAQLRTRGNFRRSRTNCLMPPLRLNVPRGAVEGTLFDGQDKLKVVGNCRPGRDSYSELVLREYLAYRILGMVSDRSFGVRLARITYEDTSGGFESWTDWGFFIEDEEAMAARLGGVFFELEDDRNLPPSVFEPVASTRLAVFQYLIGNTDWSEAQGHNVAIVEAPSGAVAVPYDFDFSGLVDASYATPDPDIGIRSVRERRYQGWCRAPGIAEAVVAQFREAREETLALIENFDPLSEGSRGEIVDYLRPFYDAIETDASARAVFLELCRRLPAP